MAMSQAIAYLTMTHMRKLSKSSCLKPNYSPVVKNGPVHEGHLFYVDSIELHPII